MPNVNFKISQELMDRKRIIGKSHPKIYLAGLMAYEGADLSKLEKPPPPKPKPKKGEFFLFITNTKTKEFYEFHVLRNNKFEKAEFKDIKEGETFRMYDQGKLVTAQGWRYFAYSGFPAVDKKNMVYVKVVGMAKEFL